MDISTLLYISIALICISQQSPVLADFENMPKFLAYDDEINCWSSESPALPIISPPWNSPYRAYRTVPPQMEITESIIPGAGIGIKSKTFIKKSTWLGEYEGEAIRTLNQISDYAWKVKRNGYAYFYVDAYDVRTSNWLRWINCSRHVSEESVSMMNCKGKILYITTQDIYPGQELFVYYGDGYAKRLKIDTKNYLKTR